ncbi:S41 family peptidase [Rhodospira trueperi]|uniref:Carboxyl-terminal processing protease n=1 Tax=Rhodospira trueperi TaxID=69960 RepID=A0A1G6Z4M0_9PROT|nr:S41 family peptidase [Rhodospira trueperi]SDD97471.1 carboxyl-terminal processing protease [Rhodospira trueperi]
MRAVLTGVLMLVQASAAVAADRLAVFDEATKVTAEQFYDPGMAGVDWDAAVAAHRARIMPEMDREAVAAEVNALLARLGTSHTRLYTRDDPAWYQLAGVFLHGSDEIAAALAPFLTDGAPRYAGIGAMVDARDDGFFVTGVLPGFPAEAAGVRVGDRLDAVNGDPYHPIRSFAGRAGTDTTLTVERSPGDRRDLTVTPVMLDGVTMFEDAMRASARVIEHNGARVGSIRPWSYAGRKYQDILAGEVLYGSLKDADALVLDLRGGWGGASPEYLTLFTDKAITMTSIGRDGTAFTFASGWTKPVVLLVDEGTRSGKELMAHGFRALGLGPIVGETTAGAVVGGRLNVLSDGSLLYVAVVDVRVDGVRLEGVGVAPDIAVPFDPAFAAGADPQFDRAVAEAARLAGG